MNEETFIDPRACADNSRATEADSALLIVSTELEILAVVSVCFSFAALFFILLNMHVQKSQFFEAKLNVVV